MTIGRRKRSNLGEPIAWKPVAVDGGWGWMVVIGSFFIHVFADGIVYSFGIMVAELLDAFGEGRAYTSWIVSLLVGLTLGTGPIASAVTNRYGCRVTTMVGALIATAGCLLSYLATSVLHLLLTVGFVMGLGFGLMYCPAIVVVTIYFEEWRALATGLAVCGAGIGTFIFSPFSSWLINEYTWRGAFLIYAGIVLNCAVCGALFRPLQFRPIYADDKDEGDELEMTVDGAKSIRDMPNEQQTLLEPTNGQLGSSAVIDGVGNMASAVDLSAQQNGQTSRRRTFSASAGYINVKDVFYSGSIQHIPEFIADPDHYRSITSLAGAGTSRRGSSIVKMNIADGREHEMVTVMVPTDGVVVVNESIVGDAWIIIKKMVDINLLMNPVFLLFAISNFLTSIGFNAPLVFLPDRAEIQLGISRDSASWILSSFGIANTVGRVFVGYLSDREWPFTWGRNASRNRLWLYNISVTICGVVTILSFLCTDLTSLIIYAALFGFTLSTYVCLTSVLLVDLLGLDRLTNAFGLLLLFQGVATLVGPPIAGEIVDRTGNYDLSFIFAGVGLAISGLILFAIPMLTKRQQQSAIDQRNSAGAN